MTDSILTEQRDHTLIVTLSRSERKNALTLDMYTALATSLTDAGQDNAVRCVLIQGKAECFTSGNDLEDFINNPPGENSPVLKFMQSLLNFPKPVVAAVQGPAVGIGTTLLLHCDLVYAGKTARFQLPFVNLGLCPEFASSLLLPQLMGHARAAEILMLGEFFDADSALNLGLVTGILPDDQVTDAAISACEKLALQPPGALRTTKSLMKQNTQALCERVIASELSLFAEGLESGEFKEAVQAFFDKRPADFTQFD